MADIAQNTNYSAATQLGQTLSNLKYKAPKVAPAPKAQPKFQNIMDNMPKNTPSVPQTQLMRQGNGTPAVLPESIAKLGGNITTPFMQPGNGTINEPLHPAVDIGGKIGTPVSAGVNGTVVSSENNADGFGKSMVVKDGNGNLVRYSHLNDKFVPVGGNVNPNTVIGELGNSGSTYSQSGKGDGANLDIRILNTAKQLFLNPLTYLK
jgi:murein DD-endopeptidase MepM/ murein hydrolase activator NlpD